MRLNFKAPFSQFFGHPKWGMNWLLLTVCLLIPVVGPIVVLGWLLRCFAAWLEDRRVPEFNFQYFGDYLKQGLWPFLVSFVVMFAMMLILVPVILIAAVGIASWAGTNPEEPEVAGLVMIILGLVIAQFLLSAIMGILLTPAMLRSGLKQDFASGFAFGFIFDFIKRSWVDLLLAQVVLIAMGMVGFFIGYIALFIGVYFVLSLFMFVQWHFYYQIYRIYLERGGEEIAVDPGLRPLAPPLLPGVPPVLPPAPPPG